MSRRILHTLFTLFIITVIAWFATAQSPCTTVGCDYGMSCTPSQAELSPDGVYHDPCGDPMLACQPNANEVDNGTCIWKGCANTDYIANWNTKLAPFPQRCNVATTYCPDNGVSCQPLVAPGGSCEEARDDECAGSVGMCLNLQCVLKSVGLNGACGIERIDYRYAYKTPGEATTQTIERDNCTTGLYCSSASLVCIPALAMGQTCYQDRDCVSGSCSSDGGQTAGQCIAPTDSFHEVKAYVYVIIGVAVAAFMIAVLFGLWYLHRVQSIQEHEEIDRFYAFQDQYQNDENDTNKVVLKTPKIQTRGSEAYVRMTNSRNPSPVPSLVIKPKPSRPPVTEDKYEEDFGTSSSPLQTAAQTRQEKSGSTNLRRKPSDVMPGTGVRYGHREQLLYATMREQYEQEHHHHPSRNKRTDQE